MSQTYDKETLEATLKQLALEVDEYFDSLKRVEKLKTIFDILVANMWFIVKYSKFRYILRKKLVEFMSTHKSDFLSYWKILYPSLTSGVDQEIRVPAECLVTSVYPTTIDMAEEAAIQETIYWMFRDDIQDIYRDRDENFMPKDFAVIAFRSASKCQHAMEVICSVNN